MPREEGILGCEGLRGLGVLHRVREDNRMRADAGHINSIDMGVERAL